MKTVIILALAVVLAACQTAPIQTPQIVEVEVPGPTQTIEVEVVREVEVEVEVTPQACIDALDGISDAYTTMSVFVLSIVASLSFNEDIQTYDDYGRHVEGLALDYMDADRPELPADSIAECRAAAR